MSTITSVASKCHDVFLEPFNQGAYNIRDGFRGKRIETILVDGALLATTREVPLSLVQRAAAVVVGTLLLVPIVNAVALMILKCANSNYLYAPVRQPVRVRPVRVPNTPVTNPVTNPGTNRVTLVPYTPPRLTPAQAVTRVGQLEAMGAGIAGNFEVSQTISTFDLDAIIDQFPADQNPSNLCNLLNWAAVDNAKHNQFRMAVEQFDANGADQHAVVKNLLSRLNSYFVHRKRVVVPGSAEETNLKAQFSANVDKIIDANNNCIDQVLSQVQEIMLDVAGDMVGIGGNEYASLQTKGGHALSTYRTNLLKAICVRQNPTEPHMADLERLVMQRLAPMLGLNGTIFNAGARYARIINDVDAKVENAANAFLAEYKPLDYLTNEIRTDGVGPIQKLRVALNLWAVEHYAIENEDPANPQPASDLNPRLSANFDPNAFLDFANGGEWTPVGTYLILESAGLIRPR